MTRRAEPGLERILFLGASEQGLIHGEVVPGGLDPEERAVVPPTYRHSGNDRLAIGDRLSNVVAHAIGPA